MDHAAIEHAGAARPPPPPKKKKPIKEPSKSPWRPTRKLPRDTEAQGSDSSSGDNSRATSLNYTKKFERDIEKRLEKIAGKKFPGNPSAQQDYVTSRNEYLRSKYSRHRYLGSDPPGTPPMFEGSITYLVKPSNDAPIIDPVRKSLVLGDPQKVMDSLENAQTEWYTSNGSGRPPAIRWIHLPANNMQWVDSIMPSVIATCRSGPDSLPLQGAKPDLMAKYVLDPKFWDNQVRSNQDNPIFSRQMDSFATHIAVPLEGHGSHHSEHKVNVLVAFMPYLHWESSIAARYMRYIADYVERKGLDLDSNAIEEDLKDSFGDRYMCQDEVLLRRYLGHGPLHPRRTLDQFYYPFSKDTRGRDYDQVVERYALKGHFNNDTKFEWELPILMVDQCWVWAIGSDTVLTAFPKTWDYGDQNRDPLDLHKTILQNAQMPIHQKFFDSSAQFARFVIRVSAVNALLPIKLTQEHHKFLQYIGHSISDLRRKRTKRYKAVLSSLKEPDNEVKLDKMLDVRAEYHMLEEAQDIMEELQMIRELLDAQDETMRQFDKAQRRFLSTGSLQNNSSKQGGPKKNIDMKDFPSNKNRRDNVEEFYRAVERLAADIQSLLNLKQQRASINEAYVTRQLNQQAAQQGTAVLAFTIVTIIFLPISTLAAIFGINTDTFGSGSLSLGRAFAYVFPISAICVISSLLIGLNRRVQGFVSESLSAPFKYISRHYRRHLKHEDIESDTEDEGEVSDDTISLASESSADSVPSLFDTGPSKSSILRGSKSQRISARLRRKKTRSNILLDTLALSSSSPYPEQATSILRRAGDRPNSYDRPRSSGRRNSRRTDVTQEPQDDYEGATYSLSESEDDDDEARKPQEGGTAAFYRSLQSVGVQRSRTGGPGRLPMRSTN